jgi:glycosyltransferase involved in cell wall biosynthesis
MKLLTLAVASYNMEAFLDQCLESVTNFDIPDSLEVLVVNDGSNDKTSNIAHVYQQLRPDIVKVIDKKNGHYGSCSIKCCNW